MKPNVLVIGASGSGKTSLLQAICGKAEVADSQVGHGSPKTDGFKPYQGKEVNFWDSEGVTPGNGASDFEGNLNEFLERQVKAQKVHRCVHVIWYCLNGPGARVTAFDVKIIKKLKNMLVIITKNDLIEFKQRGALIQELVDRGVPRERIVVCSSQEKTGLIRLLSATMSLVPKGIDDAIRAVIERRKTAFEKKTKELSSQCITWAAARAALIATIPLPVADVPLLVANEGYLIARLGALHGIPVDKQVATAFTMTLGASIVGKFVSSFLPFFKIPIAAGITYGVGNAADLWFESDMTASTAELQKIRIKAEEDAKKIDWKKKSKRLPKKDRDLNDPNLGLKQTG